MKVNRPGCLRRHVVADRCGHAIRRMFSLLDARQRTSVCGESAQFRGHVVCGPRSSLRYLDGRDWSRWPRSRRSDERGDGLCVRPHRYALANREQTRRGGGTATAQRRNPVRVKVAAHGVVSMSSRVHTVTNVKLDGEDASRCGGPRRAESMLRERGANNQCRSGRAIRSGRDAAAVGGDDWQQADSRGSGRGECAHGSVIPRDSQSRGSGQPSGWRWTMSVRLCAQALLLRNVPLVARVV